uniref:Si:ch211-114l13.9 n=1 Tax=Sinocyclocheilus grahami TaxID=75366 RepID=A0A672LZZ2_SINGR
MATTEIAILDALKELLEKELKDFKWHLSNGGTQYSSIPRGTLESADRHDTVTIMVQQYRSSDAGKIAVRVLRKIDQNELADQLKIKLQEALEKGSRQCL